MSTKKYLCIHRSVPATREPPSPAQMQEMYAVFNAWKEKFTGLDRRTPSVLTNAMLSALGCHDELRLHIHSPARTSMTQMH